MCAWDLHSDDLADLGLTFKLEKTVLPSFVETNKSLIICHINSHLFNQRTAYTITISNSQVKMMRVCGDIILPFTYIYQVKLSASDIQGLRYAISTFVQLLRLGKYCDTDGDIPAILV